MRYTYFVSYIAVTPGIKSFIGNIEIKQWGRISSIENILAISKVIQEKTDTTETVVLSFHVLRAWLW